MVTRRRVAAVWAAAALIFSTTLLAQQAPQQNTQQNRKLSDAQRREIQATTKIVDGAMAGQPMPNDLSLAWVREDLLKAQGNKQYVPFTITIDPTKATSSALTLYWRVVAQNPPAEAAAAPTAKKEDRNAKPAAPEYAYEDLTNMTVQPGQPGPLRVSRSFTVGPGPHDIYVVVKEPTPERQQRNAPPLKVSVIKHTVDVPNLWNEELNTSSVFVAERIDPLPAPLTPQQQAERPYALGAMEIVPVENTKFTKKAELSTFLLIYNAKTDAANKPDVSVEYNFHVKQAGTEKFFNKTNPQNLNAQTLPPQFDFAAGHQLQSGQAVPLASFPEGDYRLEIKVTDKLANKTITRDVNFSVIGG
jgi:hypothetical protein